MSTNVAVRGTMEFYRCPEYNSAEVTTSYQDRNIKTLDQQRCVCNDFAAPRQTMGIPKSN